MALMEDITFALHEHAIALMAACKMSGRGWVANRPRSLQRLAMVTLACCCMGASHALCVQASPTAIASAVGDLYHHHNVWHGGMGCCNGLMDRSLKVEQINMHACLPCKPDWIDCQMITNPAASQRLQVSL